jgi:phosphoribosylaminoimidazole-succinocarboxamide synthase
MISAPLSESELPALRLLHRGKVRDVYEIDEKRLLLVATDRISAFDCVLPTLIPHKGEVLTQLSLFWFKMLADVVENHLINKEKGSICGHELPPGMLQCEMLDEPIFTPATKAANGHDENIDFDTFCDIVGPETGRRLRDISIELYTEASMFAAQKPGHAQPSFDKQFVREYLETLDWDKQPPAPALPPEIALATSQRYLDAYRLLTGNDLSEPSA